LKAAEDDRARGFAALAISELAESEEGRARFVAGGACEALVEALKAAEGDETRGYAASAIHELGKSEEGRARFVELDAVGVLKLLRRGVHVLLSWMLWVCSSCFCRTIPCYSGMASSFL
jgi:hypothetical protein